MITKILDFDISKIIALNFKVSELLLKYYESDFKVFMKDDGSPVTNADQAASELIIKTLTQITPNVKVVSEENNNADNLTIVLKEELYWLIDPLDGTWSFIRKKGYFTINIALIYKGEAIWGVIGSPLDATIYFTDFDGHAYKQDSNGIRNQIHIKPFDQKAVDFLVSQRNIDEQFEEITRNITVKTVTPIPSAIKFALIAEGKGDVYPRFKDTCIWDTASGHAILNCLGGGIFNLQGTPLLYNTPNIINPKFIAISDASFISLLINKT
jgi:3'(2'), 5'-bisphosphate nucleotidase